MMIRGSRSCQDNLYFFRIQVRFLEQLLHGHRIYQQYFMVSNGAQFILMECEQKGYDLHKLYDHVVIQINDTHPSMVIPELIRLLQERGFTMQEAIDVVRCV